ncbi:DNA cytosine methyltransferase [Holophaga foetida]|uniref:DNA cytosine methyltransferase n=1 Tax=Holophaga foetida TaxID=35839 RepID=UPI0002475361|nr:DNA cytosine methyltransferase [Holophaga foetida]
MLNAIEFFSGIGGWRYALGDQGKVVRAYDISPAANDTYAHNHGDRPWDREIASLDPSQVQALKADTWLMSPPCQPFCRMGNHRGLEDLRSKAFLHLMDLLRLIPPEHLVLENVIGFLGSDAHELLAERLRASGMHWREYQLCPTQFGIPNLRPRVYLVASRHPIADPPLPEMPPLPLAAFLDPQEDESLYLRHEESAKHGPGLALVNPESRTSACFIGGYGKRFVGSGPFLRTPQGIRRFSPEEVARLLGLPREFRFPDSISRTKRYKLLGNGLSIPVARWVTTLLSPC